MDIYEEASRVRQMSEIYGGSFVKALFNVLHYADIHNMRLIKQTWREEWDKYLQFYELDSN